MVLSDTAPVPPAQPRIEKSNQSETKQKKCFLSICFKEESRKGAMKERQHQRPESSNLRGIKRRARQKGNIFEGKSSKSLPLGGRIVGACRGGPQAASASSLAVSGG